MGSSLGDKEPAGRADCDGIYVDTAFCETRVNLAGCAGTVDEDGGRSLPLKATKGRGSVIRFPVP